MPRIERIAIVRVAPSVLATLALAALLVASGATPSRGEQQPAEVPQAPAPDTSAQAPTESPTESPTETLAESPVDSPTDPPAWLSLEVYPSEVALGSAQARQRLIAVARRADGVTRDVTAETDWTVAAPVVSWAADNDNDNDHDAETDSETKADSETDAPRVLVPQTNGQTLLAAAWQGLAASCEATVEGAEVHREASFAHDVMPILMRAGCNAGGCHGAALGKDGFRLSLFGFDPQGDHFRLTRELATRRLNLALPTESLLLQKAAGQTPHTGGKLLEPAGPHYEQLRAWIAGGARNDVASAATVARLEIYPPRAVLEGESRQQFIAVAHYSDGSQRDVSDLAVFLSNNESAAAVDADGLVVSGQRGEAFITARFATHTVGSQVLTLPPGAEYAPPATPAANYIDELVEAKLQTLRVAPSGLCSDEEFLRRVLIDVVGRLPERVELETFLADGDPQKRAHKIDELLAQKEFAELWAMKFAELLLVRTEPNRVEYKPMFLYWQWLQQQIADGVPLDAMVRDLLSASGGSFAEPAVNFYQIEPMPEKIAENAAQALLGIRIQCAQCHNHPFDRWTMDDYYAFSAFFAQIGRKRAEDYRETVVFDRRAGEANHLVTGQPMTPKFLGGEAPQTKGRDRRAVVAEWIAAPENPYFSVSIANRIWAHFFGVGIVEPVDDIRVSNPPSNPELFERLGSRLVEYNYDIRRLVREICNSNAYQRSSQVTDSNAEDHRNFAKAAIRRLPAEVLLDCICQVVGVPDKFPGLPLGARAVQIADGRAGNYFLQTFGRARRDTVCACEVQAEPTLSQALHLLNGPTVSTKVAQGKQVEAMLDAGRTPSEVIDDIYLRCLARLPTAAEREDLLTLCGDVPRPAAELQDIYWAVLNSREFLFNH